MRRLVREGRRTAEGRRLSVQFRVTMPRNYTRSWSLDVGTGNDTRMPREVSPTRPTWRKS